MFSTRISLIRQMARWLIWLYAAVLAALLFVRFVFGDFSWWSFALNSMLLYAFVPVPFVWMVALFTRRHDAWVIALTSSVVWAWLWGDLFVPHLPAVQAGDVTLTAMTYNILGFNMDTVSVLNTIKDSNADVVGLQELNPENAEAIKRELSDEYPYQWLQPEPGVTGSGLISRYPFERLAATPLDTVQWVSSPTVVDIDVQNYTIRLVRFHAVANPVTWQAREQQAELLTELVRSYDGALIVLGDLNATDQNDAYTIIARELKDAWREAGSGFGHTFPGADRSVSPGSSRPVFGSISVPQWLVRIDFIFHSDELTTIGAWFGKFDGMSDHRPVIAMLTIR